MLAGIMGDVVGSVYEAYQWQDKNLTLFQPLPIQNNILVQPLSKNVTWVRQQYSWTDDTLCTLALYKAFINNEDPTKTLREVCAQYRNEDIGFGKAFNAWIDNPVPYESYGNGSIMRIGFIPFLDLELNEKIDLGYNYTVISHNHEDSYNAVTNYIILCEMLQREKASGTVTKKCLQKYLNAYKIVSSVEAMHQEKKFVINALETLHQAVVILLESDNMEEVLRNTFYIGGDSDTLACVACNLASIIYDIPSSLWLKSKETLNTAPELMNLVEHFEKNYGGTLNIK